MGANGLVEFEKNFLTGPFFSKLGAMGANVLVEFEKKNLSGGIFFKLGANLLMEFVNVFNWRHFL